MSNVDWEGQVSATRKDIPELQRRWNAIAWYSAVTVTPEAERFVQEHLVRMRRVFDHLLRVEKKSPLDAYSDAQSAGYSADLHDELFDAVYDGVALGGVYTTTFDQDDDTQTLDVVLEYPGHRKSYPLVGDGVPPLRLESSNTSTTPISPSTRSRPAPARAKASSCTTIADRLGGEPA